MTTTMSPNDERKEGGKDHPCTYRAPMELKIEQFVICSSIQYLPCKRGGICLISISKKAAELADTFFNDTATTEIYTILFVGSVRCV